MNIELFERGKSLDRTVISKIKDRKAKGIVIRSERNIKNAVELAARSNYILHSKSAGYIQTEGSFEKTFKLSQADITHAPDISLESSRKSFSLSIPNGPYCMDYSKSGKSCVIGGLKGQISAFEWKTGKLLFENNLGSKEKIHDVCWLQDDAMIAVAQRKCVYIYDNNGLEVHSLKNHPDSRLLEFLSYHSLLVTSGSSNGYLRYQDITTGQVVSECKAGMGTTISMAQNPSNAVMSLGHEHGTVTMWTPVLHKPLIKMMCHRGPVKSLIVSNDGKYLATTGLDCRIHIWDLRSMYKKVKSYYVPSTPCKLSISQEGLLAVGYSSRITIWKDIFRSPEELFNKPDPYLNHEIKHSSIHDIQFCSFEDVMGIGHSLGFDSILVPGSGNPNYDSFEANPFQTKKQRRETRVKSLLEKLQPDTIGIDMTFIGKVSENEEKNVTDEKTIKKREKKRVKRHLRKQQNVIDEKRRKMEEKIIKDRKEKMNSLSRNLKGDLLDRFRS